MLHRRSASVLRHALLWLVVAGIALVAPDAVRAQTDRERSLGPWYVDANEQALYTRSEFAAANKAWTTLAGPGRVRPPACFSWKCPKVAPFTSSCYGKCLTEGANWVAKLEATIETRRRELIDRLAKLPEGTATLVRDSRDVATGPLRDIRAQASDGDRIVLSPGRHMEPMGARVVSYLTVVGQGANTVLFADTVRAVNTLYENLTLHTPRFTGAVSGASSGPVMLYQVNLVQYDYAYVPSLQWFESGFGVEAFEPIMLGGNVGVVAPSKVHRLPFRAYGTRGSTAHANEQAYPLFGGQGPTGGVYLSLAANPLGSAVASIEVQRERDLWKAWWPPMTDVRAALLRLAPSDTESAQPNEKWERKGYREGYRLWLARVTQPVNVRAIAGAREVVDRIRTDVEAGRPYSALARAALAKVSGGYAADADTLVALAQTEVGLDATCNVMVDWDTATRGPQNAGLRMNDVSYDASLFKIGPVVEDALDQYIPASALGRISRESCVLRVLVALDIWQYEKRVGTARVDKTEWWPTAQLLAKQRAAGEQALTSMGQAFEAAGRSMEQTWQSFDAYRTRVVTTQLGDQYLVSTRGNTNTRPTGFKELDALRAQRPVTGGPGAAGDYRATVTYVVEATRQFRHRMDLTLTASRSAKVEWTSRPVTVDETWSGGNCEDRFIDNGDQVREGGTTCFLDAGYKGLTAASRGAASAAVGLASVVRPRLAARADRAARTGTPEGLAEAAVIRIAAGGTPTAAETAALATVTGPGVTREQLLKAFSAIKAAR